MDRVILHCDANNFYASVEMKLHPELKGKAIAVCGSTEDRHGIVLAKSEPAKKCDVKTGDVIWQAKLKCPDLIVVKPTYSEYVKYSNLLFNIYTQYTDRVESFGLDECWLDVTHSKIFGDGKEIAELIRERVKKELGITVSIGVSFNKVFAKLGSDYKKPDAITVIDRNNYLDITENLPACDMLMIGKKTTKALLNMNVQTIGDIRRIKKNTLEKIFGKNGVQIHQWANGNDYSPVKYYYQITIPKSISNGITTYRDLKNRDDACIVIRSLVDLISTRLLHLKLNASTMHVTIKFPDFTYFSKQATMQPTNNPSRLYACAKNIIYKNFTDKVSIRSINISVTNLEEDSYIQLDFLDPTKEKDHKLDLAINNIKAKYGYKSIVPATSIVDKRLCEDIVETDFTPFKR